jgi:hypothetical protein
MVSCAAIPAHTTLLADAHERLFHVKYPHWRHRMDQPGVFATTDALAEHDCDERAVTQLLYGCFADGSIAAYVLDPSGRILQLR